MLCRHCQRTKASRPRGLCWACYYTAGVRERYPSTSKFARHGIGDSYGQVQLPTSPTFAAPGTPEKVSVLEARAQLRQGLWHPLDAQLDSEAPVLTECGMLRAALAS